MLFEGLFFSEPVAVLNYEHFPHVLGRCQYSLKTLCIFWKENDKELSLVVLFAVREQAWEVICGCFVFRIEAFPV